MSSESDSVAPISAPNTGPDPRTSHRLDVPPPDARPDVRDLDPSPGTSPGPAAHGGLQPMSATDTAPDPRIQAPTTPLTGTDPRIQAPTTPLTGNDPRTSHEMPAPDGRTDVRDLDPAPGTNPGPPPSNGIQAMSAGGGPSGGPGVGVQAGGGLSGVDDPAALNRAGQGAYQLGSLVQSNGRVGDDEQMIAATAALGADFWGGQLGLELMKTMETWDKQAKKLSNTCAAIGDRCTTTANSYTTTESANDQEMSTLQRSLADFN
ncbi:hypothetical protein [Streptomyces sp. NBC_01304]|uniref:hypothetical protein n=1 Tax=Streptomyces sp. NBC_01304 TaxID=2903818 RepID=UPI002E0F49F9|nr:hypothetical protein OG430_23340 [Streptomyces sp. NBC_01304]